MGIYLTNEMTLSTKLADILVLSQRPTQLMLCISAFLIALAIIYRVSIGEPPYLLPTFNNWIAAALFAIYSVICRYCCFSITKTTYHTVLQYTSSITGVILWSTIFAVEMSSHHLDSMALYLMPVVAEAWSLAQLTSKVRQRDRRAL